MLKYYWKVLKIKPKEYFKEKFFSFLKGVKNVDNEVQEFWEKEYRKIKLNLIEGKENLVVISASPEFLLNPICKKLKVEKLIASKVNKSTGKYIGKNCYGKEKVNRLNSEYEKYIIKEFYSDSQSDKYLAEIAEKSFIVNRDKITQQ